jgi:hypothetical protein
MLCNVCECSDFISSDYVMPDGRKAPALECTGCHAIVLDEVAAHTEEERESVKLAKAIRAEIIEGSTPSFRKGGV